MSRHGSMNRIFRLIWSEILKSWVAVAETARGRGKGKNTARKIAAAALALNITGSMVPQALAGPTDGIVKKGTATISQQGATTTIKQATTNALLDWGSFNIGVNETVNFVQPSAKSITVNNILSTNGSQILGNINANGAVFLINPNGILFGPHAQVNVGGLVASTLNYSDTDSAAKSFSGAGTGSVINQGNLTAKAGGYLVLLANSVSNQGTMTAPLGVIALGAGSAATLTLNDHRLAQLRIDQGVLNSLASNGGLMQADGGAVILNAGAKNELLASVVNNTGVIEARTVQNNSGTITLLAGMAAGTVNVAGTLDASAPTTGNGGAIDTSAAHVKIAPSIAVTTKALAGKTGTWLIDPTDYTIAPAGTPNSDETGATLSGTLNSTNVTIASSSGGFGSSGNINVNDAVTWDANTVLTLQAQNNINISQPITAGVTQNGANAGVLLAYGLANPASGNTSTVNFSGNGTINLQATGSFQTLQGNDLNLVPTSYGIITSLAGLQGMVSPSNSAPNVVLGSNLDATSTATWNNGAGFTPINTFDGAFNGLNHTISNLTINLPNDNYVGLFSTISQSGSVSNVNLDMAHIAGLSAVGALAGWNSGLISTSSVSGSITGLQYNTGGLAGLNDGTIVESSSTANVSGGIQTGGVVGFNLSAGVISASFASGSVTGADSVGGLAGISYGSINNAYANGKVVGSGSNVGGLIGNNSGFITNSYAIGSTTGISSVGGLAGLNQGTLQDSYAIAVVKSVDVSTGGTLVGYNNGGNVNLTYAAGSVNGNSSAPLVGSNAGTVSSSYLAIPGLQSAGAFADFTFTTQPGQSGNNWVMFDASGNINSNVGLNYPMLSSEYATTIINPHQLQLMSMAPAANYQLANNINASGTNYLTPTDVWSSSIGFVPVGNLANPFTGAFNGRGYTISGLTTYLADKDNIGMFGVVGNTGTISNLTLTGENMLGNNNVGGIAGSNSGTLVHSSTSGLIQGINNIGGLFGYDTGHLIANSFSSANVTGVDDVGGLAGQSSSTIQNSYSSSVVRGRYAIGGLVGTSSANIVNSYAAGGDAVGSNGVGGLVGVNNGTIASSYAADGVFAITTAGGLVGIQGTGSVQTSFWDMDISGQSFPLLGGGAVGLSTVNMKNFAEFTATTAENGGNPQWDFTNTWFMYPTHTYPLLQSFLTPLSVSVAGSTTYVGAATNIAANITWFDGQGLPIVAPSQHVLGTVNSGPTHAGSYSVTPGGVYSDQQGYMITFLPGSLTINPLTLTETASIVPTNSGSLTKTYDGNAIASGATLAFGANSVVGNDTVGFTDTGVSLTYNSLHAGAATLISASGGTPGIYIIRGAGSPSDYIVIAPTIAPVSAGVGITPFTVTENASIVPATSGSLTKTYDGNTTATGATLAFGAGSGAGNDVLSFNDTGVSLTYNSLHAGAATFIGASGGTPGVAIVSGNGLPSDYNVLAPNIGLVSVGVGITPFTLNETATIVPITSGSLTKTFDGNTSATGAKLAFGASSAAGNDMVSFTDNGVSLNYNSKHVGLATSISASGGTAGVSIISGNGLLSDYNLVAPTIAPVTNGVKISAEPVTVSINPVTETYNGSPVIAPNLVTPIVLSGQLYGDNLSAANGTFTFTNNGAPGTNIPISVSGITIANSADAADYKLTNVNSTGTIIKAQSTVTLTVVGAAVVPKLYDGTTTATLVGTLLKCSKSVLTNCVKSGDTVTLTQSGKFASANAGSGTAIAVTATDTLGGSSAGNYTLIVPTGLKGYIYPDALLATGTAQNKVYDGNTNATISNQALWGVLAGNVTVTETGKFASASVGTWAVKVTDSLNFSGGAIPSNYVLLDPTFWTTAKITPRSAGIAAVPLVASAIRATSALTNVTIGLVNGAPLAATITTKSPSTIIDPSSAQTGLVVVEPSLSGIPTNLESGTTESVFTGSKLPVLRIKNGGLKLPDNSISMNN